MITLNNIKEVLLFLGYNNIEDRYIYIISKNLIAISKLTLKTTKFFILKIKGLL